MYVLVCAELRNSSLEQIDQVDHILYYSQRAEVLEMPNYSNEKATKFSFRFFFHLIKASDSLVLELPEPLFVRYWFKSALVAYAAKLYCTKKRISLIVATYAIENLEHLRRCSLPLLDNFRPLNEVFAVILTKIIIVTSSTIDYVGYGTKAAEINYERAKFFRKAKFSMIASKPLEICPCIKYDPKKINLVMCLGEKSERKSTNEIYLAFRELASRYKDWTFLMIGPQIDSYVSPDLVNFRLSPSIPRTEIHSLLRASKLVVLASKRQPRWREQIGLPILEGLAHQNRVVATTESGLFSPGFLAAPVNWIGSSDVTCLIETLSGEIENDGIIKFSLPDIEVPSVTYFRRYLKLLPHKLNN